MRRIFITYAVHLGSSINDVTVLGQGGGLGFCDNSTTALVIKCVTKGERVSRVVKNCARSFMDDPFPFF